MCIKEKTVPLFTFIFLCNALFAVPVMVFAADSENATQALFTQAQYWHDKANNKLAMESLHKILLVNPHDQQALYLMALWSQQSGDAHTTDTWRNRLASVAPDDPRLQTLDDIREVQKLPQGQLSLARQQARSGNIDASLATWRTLFRGDIPPPAIASEYYLTMGANKKMYPQAINELRELTRRHPQDTGLRLALAKLLTYQDTSRREGISILQSLAEGNPDADKALRQALTWLSPRPGDEGLYQKWMQRHPDDRALMQYWRQGAENEYRGEGFTALNNGDLTQARQDFSAVLQNNPEDADALAGMGYVAQRSGDFASAAKYLEHAAKLGGAESADRQLQAQDAAFYARLATAQEAFKRGDIKSALAISAPLVSESGNRGSAASLFRADVLRKDRQYPQAESTLRELLARQPDNEQAREELYYILQDAHKTEEAGQLLRTLPVSVQARLQKGSGRKNAPDEAIRKQASQKLESGEVQQAETILRQGLLRLPGDPWLSLDLARLLQKQGKDDAAMQVMLPFFHGDNRTDALYAAALYSVDNNAWQQARGLMERIAVNRQDSDMKKLVQRVNFNLHLLSAQQLMEQGNTISALSSLRKASTYAINNPVDTGRLARLMAQGGDLQGAVQLVRESMQKGVQGNAGEYADQLDVLNEAGLSSEASSWLNNPELQARSTPGQLAGLQVGYSIHEADNLRLQGKYAEAYDILTRALQSTPEDYGLISAMARLYESGKRPAEAAQIYHWLMTRDNTTQDARTGAINLAIAQDDTELANKLAVGLHPLNTPERLLLQARLQEATGNRQQALSYLREARGKLLGFQRQTGSTSPEVAGMVLADNPFMPSDHHDRAKEQSSSLYGTVMPWQVSAGAQVAARSIPGTVRVDLPAESARTGTLREIDSLMEKLDDETDSWFRVSPGVRSRDGESGLSDLTAAEVPLTWSSVPLGDSRFEMTVTPVMMNAGSASGDAARRQGTGATGNGIQSLVQTFNTMQNAVKAMTGAEQAEWFAANPEMRPFKENILSDSPLASFNEFSPFTDTGRKNLNALRANKALQNFLVSSAWKPSVNQEYQAQGQDLEASGVALSMILSGESYQGDIGTTPLNDDPGTLVGGISWEPKLSKYLSLRLAGERRSVTDSILSWAGLRDRMSGERWGRITKNGASIQLSYDDGDAGYYIGGGHYLYRGKNVAENRSTQVSAGVYVRPWHDPWRQLQAGISTSWMDYSKNLSYFTFGQGGYFSPANYISISLPVDYSLKKDNWKLSLAGAVGYQSYSQNSSPYYPTRSDWQHMLDNLADNGFTRESRYQGNTENGLGYSFNGGLDYRLDRSMIISGKIGYDTFGDYSETTAGLGFRYIPGGE
ncbi:TPA: cellulose synthase [Citrobacter freundii]|nr:cellulose synthase [Citrobacter freundii]